MYGFIDLKKTTINIFCNLQKKSKYEVAWYYKAIPSKLKLSTEAHQTLKSLTVSPQDCIRIVNNHCGRGDSSATSPQAGQEAMG